MTIERSVFEFTITGRSEFRRGISLAMPVLPGTAAWGLVSGVAMIKAGLDVPQAIVMTLLMFAGSAQLACLPLIAAGAPISVMLVTAAVVNLRFIIYGLGLAPAFRGERTWTKLLLGYLNADPGYALFAPRFNEDPTRPYARSLYLGIVTSNWATWQVVSVVGVLAAARIPSEWGLELAGLLALIALAIPVITTLPTVAGVCVAVGVALVGIDWPLRLGIIGGVAAGVAAAMLVESLTTSVARNRVMSELERWAVIVALSVVTLLTRAAMLFLPAGVRLSPRVQRALRYAGPCILMAIVVPDLLRRHGAIDLGLDNIRLMAALVAVAIFLVTRSAPLTILVGLLVLTGLRLSG